jgi:hypothetical protein
MLPEDRKIVKLYPHFLAEPRVGLRPSINTSKVQITNDNNMNDVLKTFHSWVYRLISCSRYTQGR